MTPTDTFQTHRPRLFALAYRLLGSRSDAEDIVQDAWLRWQGCEGAEGWR
jgi:RNA polymerase sigma-70 factor (ECF subfamily)